MGLARSLLVQQLGLVRPLVSLELVQLRLLGSSLRTLLLWLGLSQPLPRMVRSRQQLCMAWRRRTPPQAQLGRRLQQRTPRYGRQLQQRRHQHPPCIGHFQQRRPQGQRQQHDRFQQLCPSLRQQCYRSGFHFPHFQGSHRPHRRPPHQRHRHCHELFCSTQPYRFQQLRCPHGIVFCSVPLQQQRPHLYRQRTQQLRHFQPHVFRRRPLFIEQQPLFFKRSARLYRQRTRFIFGWQQLPLELRHFFQQHPPRYSYDQQPLFQQQPFQLQPLVVFQQPLFLLRLQKFVFQQRPLQLQPLVLLRLFFQQPRQL